MKRFLIASALILSVVSPAFAHHSPAAFEAQKTVSLTGTSSRRGYWVLTTDGTVLPFGDAVHHGDPKTYGARPITLSAAG